MKKSGLHKTLKDSIYESSKIIKDSVNLIPQIEESIHTITKCILKGNKVVLFGNGGSAADAQHIAAELIGRFKINRSSYPAIALTADSSIITALGNDYHFREIFARQCESLVKKGDVILAISTSGNSENILRGVQVAKKNGAIIIGLTGKDGGKLKSKVDLLLNITSKQTPRIQEGHRILIHTICELVERHLA